MLISVLATLLLVNCSFTHGESHLVCKTMNDIFDSGNPSGELGRGKVQGPAGKRGPQGLKGEPGGIGQKGMKGGEGVVSYANVNATIQAYLQQVVKRLEILESEALKARKGEVGARSINSSLKDLEMRLEPVDHLATWAEFNNSQCDIVYGNMCYWFEIRASKSVNFDQAKVICHKQNSTIGYPVDSTHYERIMEYIRTQMPNIASEYRVWTGLNIVPSTQSVTLPDGQPAPYVNWLPKEPTGGSGDTNLYFYVLKKATKTYQGMADFVPTSPFHGVMCQYEHP